jgi:hypothetical protein
VTHEALRAKFEAQPDVSLEGRLAMLEGQVKQLQDIVREHIAAPGHPSNPEPLRELQTGLKKPTTQL